jgi:hypothetical protein
MVRTVTAMLLSVNKAYFYHISAFVKLIYFYNLY